MRSRHTAGQSLHGCCSKRHIPSGNPPCCLPPLTQTSLSSHVLSQCPPAASPNTGHRGSPSPPASTPNSSCAVRRGHPSQHHSPSGFALAQDPPPRSVSPAPRCPFSPAASSGRASPKVLTAIGEMAQQIATINNLLIFINIQISRLQKLKGGG